MSVMWVGLALLKHIDKRSQGGGNQTSKRVCESFTTHEGESSYQGHGRGRFRESDDYRREYTPFVPLQEPVAVLASYVARTQMPV